MEIALLRLFQQRLARVPLMLPEDVVFWLGAVQSQDYGGAKWGVAQRSCFATNADLDQSFNEGSILRTHLLRPTWHFVMPQDIRWMLKLTGPRVHSLSAYYYRQKDLDDAVFAQSHEVLTKALRDHRYLTRPEIGQALADAGILTDGLRLAYILMHAEQEGLVCSGPLRGKQFTYALLEERVAPFPILDREPALAELALRYFVSHGPATPQDFANWSSLSVSDAKLGAELCGDELVEENGFWLAANPILGSLHEPIVHLLPNYDEHLIAYKDYRPAFDDDIWAKLDTGKEAIYQNVFTQNGKVVGGWRRTLRSKRVEIELKPLGDYDEAAMQQAAERYGQFLGLEAVFV